MPHPLLLCILIPFIALANKQEPTFVNQTNKLKAIRAIKKKYPGFSSADYHLLATDSESPTRASFAPKHYFIPKGKCFSYHVSWEPEVGVSKDTIFCADNVKQSDSELFILSPAARKAVRFVLSAAKKNGQPTDRAKIYERENGFFVSVGGPGWDRGYTVDKKTGKVHEEFTGTDAPEPDSGPKPSPE
jgi:hypothetical protein